jgi:TRAP-type C4-dicarboxylate transport system permease small subunit
LNISLKRLLLNLDDIISSVSLVAIILLTILGVLFRYVFNAPIQFIEEVSEGLIIWVVFMGASSAMKRGAHIGIDIIVDEMGPRLRKIFNIISLLITTSLLIFLCVYGYKLAIQAGMKITPLLKVPYTYIDMAVPIGSLYMIFQLILKIWKVIGDKTETSGRRNEL